MPTEGERLATLEQQVRDLRDDMAELTTEVRGVRKRVHNLEGIAGTFASIQQANRQAEARQYQRLGTAVAIAGFLVSFALLVLTAVTVWLHHG